MYELVISLRWIPLALLLACNGDKDADTDTDTTPTGDTGEQGTDGTLLVGNANNFTYLSDWTIPTVEIGEGLAVGTNWNDLTRDAWGATRAPSSYDRALLLKFAIPQASFVDRFETNDVWGTPPAIVGRWELEANNLFSVQLTDLQDFAKNPFDPTFELLESPTQTWLFALADVADERLDVRAAMILSPTFKSKENQAVLSIGDSEASFEAIINGDPVAIEAGNTDYFADWTGLTATGQGAAYDVDVGNELFIGHWAAGEPVTQLANLVNILQTTTQRFWTQDVEGRSTASLDVSIDGMGQPFPGFTAGGTWLMGVRCTTCFSPAPLWVAEIDVQ